MATAPLLPGVATGTDDLVVEPLAASWHRRLVAELPDAASPDMLAEAAALHLAGELRADHVALWTREGEEYVVLGAAGLSIGARRMRLPTDYPVVNVCNGSGGRIRRDDGNHHGPRAPGLPGSSSRAYAMVMLDDAGPVELLTMAGRQLDDTQVDAVCDLVELAFGDRPQGH